MLAAAGGEVEWLDHVIGFAASTPSENASRRGSRPGADASWFRAVKPIPPQLPRPPVGFSRRGARCWVSAAALGCLLAAARPASAESERSGRLTPDVASLAKGAFVRLPPPPAWEAQDAAGVWTAEEIRAAFARATDTPPQINHVRTEFLRPRVQWLREFKGWFAKLERPLKLRFEGEQWDCDNYANCFVTFADLLALRSGESRGTLGVGWATVYYRRPFAGIEGGAHAVVIAAAAEGLFVIEPQDGTMVPIEKFPNRDTIEAVYF